MHFQWRLYPAAGDRNVAYPRTVGPPALLLCWILRKQPARPFTVARFPRTNIPGAMADAQAELISRILVSLLGGAIATAATAAYLMWTGSM